MSSHCSSSLPGSVATTPILATLYMSLPCVSLNCFGHCGATLSMSAVAPHSSKLSRGLCRGFVFSRGNSDTPGCGSLPAFAPSADFNTKAQSSSDCRLPFAVRHPLFGRSFSPRGSRTLAAVSQENFSLSLVQNLCAVMIWSDFTVRLMEIGKWCSFEAFTRSNLKAPVMASDLPSLSL